MTDSEYRRALILGAIVGASLAILAIYVAKPDPSTHLPTPESNFEVVDKYKNCEVVRWTDNQLANYQFFLNCK